jgi:hypothetical protein
MTTRKKNKYHNKTKRVFTKKDFSSGDGFLVSVWGPVAWTFLHTISFNYPLKPTKEDKTHYRDFILNLQNVLPCGFCRKNLKTNFKQNPLKISDMKNRETFSRYIYQLHETVNKLLNKKSNLSYCDVRERYEHFRSRCTEERPKILKLNNTINKKGTRRRNKNEKGCTEPLYGKKSKCVINIVPQEEKINTFNIDKKCIKTREKQRE